MSTIIFPGKFQPFHNGHLMVVQGMTKVSDNVVIIICHDATGTDEPFTLDQRREMISAALLAVDIMDVTIATVKDTPSDADWVDQVLEAADSPSSPIIWTGNPDVKQLFEQRGIDTKNIVPVPGIVSAEIRDLMAAKDPTWRSKIPAGAIDVVEGVVNKN
jgi:nicotinamide-nucleotide adenylyltransferase